MDERELRELQDPNAWDLERAERRPPVKSGRTVVSVAFPRKDFARVAMAAERLGQRISEFIREAALEKASDQTRHVILAASSSSGSAVFPGRPNSTRVVGVVVRQEEAAITA